MAANFAGIDPIRRSARAVLNGVVAVPILAIMVRVAACPKVMGQFAIGRPLQAGGWIAAAVMAASVLAMVATAAMGTGG